MVRKEKLNAGIRMFLTTQVLNCFLINCFLCYTSVHQAETTSKLLHGISIFVISNASKNLQIPVLCIEIPPATRIYLDKYKAMPHYLHISLFFQWKGHNQWRPWETKAVGPGNICVEGPTPAAFQFHVQTKPGYFPSPTFSLPVFRGRKVGQPGLEEAGMCSSHIFLSWI